MERPEWEKLIFFVMVLSVLALVANFAFFLLGLGEVIWMQATYVPT